MNKDKHKNINKRGDKKMLNKKDKIEIAEIVLSVIKASEKPDEKPVKKSDVKVATKPKKVIPSSEKPSVLKDLTLNEREKIWGELDTKNIFSKKYSCAHKLYKEKNIEGRPNITYLEAWNEFVLPIAKGKKKTTKQIQMLKNNAIKQLEQKMKDNEEKQPRFWDKRNHWIQKGIEGIKSPSPK